MKREYVFAIVLVLVGVILGAFGLQLVSAPTDKTIEQERKQTMQAVRETPKNESGVIAVGDKNAPVKVVEFADMTCTYCAKAHAETIVKLKKDYIDTGKVYYEIRLVEILSHDSKKPAIAAHCAAAQNKSWQFVDGAFMTFLEDSANAYDEANLVKLAKKAGVDMEVWQTCRDSGTFDDRLTAAYNDMQELGVSGTPYFLVHDKPYNGAPSYAVFKALVESQLKEKR